MQVIVRGLYYILDSTMSDIDTKYTIDIDTKYIRPAPSARIKTTTLPAPLVMKFQM